MDADAPLRNGMPVAFCAAFPEGIPDAILFGGFDHRDPFGGEERDADGKPILFELRPGEEDALKGYERAVERLGNVAGD